MIGKPLKDTCKGCGKVRFLANKTRKLCTSCVTTEKKEKKKEKVKKVKQTRASLITQGKLDQMTSWLVRTLYPPNCPHCGAYLDSSNSNCGHFVSRTKQSTRFSLKNMVAVDRSCNFYRPEHAYSIGKYLNQFWGPNTADQQIIIGNKKLKLNSTDREKIYKVFKEILERAQGCTQEQKFELLKEAQIGYEEIVNPLIK